MAIDEGSLPGDAVPLARLGLEQNYPNPFNPQTTIAFSLPRAENVRLSVFDLRGRLVRTLVDGQHAGGDHAVIWDGNDQAGQRVASGSYVYRLTTDSQQLNKVMVLVK